VLDGTFVNTNVPPQYPDGSPDFYIKDPAFLQSEATHAWWIDGEYNPSRINAAFGEGLTFDNGQYVAVASHGKFTMHRPRLVGFQMLPAPCNPNLNSGNLEHGHDFGTTPNGNDILQYGGPKQVNETNVGYQPAYTVNVDCLTNFNGYAYITQLVNGYETNAAISIDTLGNYELDNSKIYPVPNNYAVRIVGGLPSDSKLALKDLPWITCISNTVQNLQFVDNIRFQPDGGIVVTLGTLSWNVADSTEYNSDKNDYTPVIPPWANVPYNMTTGTGHTDSSPTRANTLPYWDHTAHNVQY
jgi:hypothetical protein